MKRNKGYSLVELLVVIAIMGILIGAGITMSGVIPRFRLSSCRKNIISQLENTRTAGLSFRDAYLILYRTADGIYADTATSGTGSGVHTEKVGDGSVTLYYVLGNGGTQEELTPGNTLKLSYDRSSGAFKYPEINGAVKSDYCTELTLVNGSRRLSIRLIQVTGKAVAE